MNLLYTLFVLLFMGQYLEHQGPINVGFGARALQNGDPVNKTTTETNIILDVIAVIGMSRTNSTLLRKTWRGSCGGVRISNRAILTAAHCVDESSTYGYYALGLSHTQYDVIGKNLSARLSSSQYTKHYKHIDDDKHKRNDIALITLNKPTSFNPDHLPMVEKCFNLPARANVIFYGYGSDMRNLVLKSGVAIMIKGRECKGMYGHLRYFDPEEDVNSFYCIPYYTPYIEQPHKARVQSGDSGSKGPVVIKDKGKKKLVGIIVTNWFGKLPNGTIVLGFTKIQSIEYYRPWIMDQLRVSVG